VNANFTKTLGEDEKFGFRFVFGRNNFYSSGRFRSIWLPPASSTGSGTSIPPTAGTLSWARVGLTTARPSRTPGTLRVPTVSCRARCSISTPTSRINLNDPVNGDAISSTTRVWRRGRTCKYTRPHHSLRESRRPGCGINITRTAKSTSVLYRANGTGHDPPVSPTRRHKTHVTKTAAIVQENLEVSCRAVAAGRRRSSLRTQFRYDVIDFVVPPIAVSNGPGSAAGGQGNRLPIGPRMQFPLTFHVNYGRGINSVDARVVVHLRRFPRLATTDFYEAGTPSNFGTALAHVRDVFPDQPYDWFLDDPDDGTYELPGTSRSYGYELASSVALKRHPGG